MWVCKYCETQNHGKNTRCFLCGFVDEPNEILLHEEHHESEPLIEAETDTIAAAADTAVSEIFDKPESSDEFGTHLWARSSDEAEGRMSHDIRDHHDGFPPVDKRRIPDDAEARFEDEMFVAAAMKKNKKKQNRIKAVLAAVNILLAIGNGVVCYFVLR